MPIDVIDLFAGPGGLGEGFASLNRGSAFRIAVSAEMENSAHSTLTLRAFYRCARREGDKRAIDAYYLYCNQADSPHPSINHPLLWKEATQEAQKLTLGDPAANATLDRIVNAKKLRSDNTVLIGGPPCQAYSLVGRSRNMGKKDYVAANDHRHFLYQEYLRILSRARPGVFVMENVKGILSSKVNERVVFHDILRDLTDPAAATGNTKGPLYTIYSLSTATMYTSGMDIHEINPADFIVRSEDHGVPQARHRVILLGIREDLMPGIHPLLPRRPHRSVRLALADLPKLRSRLSHDDSGNRWYQTVSQLAKGLARDARQRGHDLADDLTKWASLLRADLSFGADRLPLRTMRAYEDEYLAWVRDKEMEVWLHHESRSHMASDLGRYFYSATFTKKNGRSPKGAGEFDLLGLAPMHANWETGKFADRFRTQGARMPSTTITSHIAKDGHYFIHPDPTQCRSLTVREAARLQSFPDSYFFEGNRTQKYHQVGNAVPPFLAAEIARRVVKIFNPS